MSHGQSNGLPTYTYIPEGSEVFGRCVKVASTLSGAKCTSHGAKEGELVTSTLEGVLDRESFEADKVGLALFPASSGSLIEGSCGSTAVKIGGSVIAPITDINKMVRTFTLKCKATKGIQEPEAFEKEPTDVLEATIGAETKQTGLTAKLTLSNEESRRDQRRRLISHHKAGRARGAVLAPRAARRARACAGKHQLLGQL